MQFWPRPRNSWPRESWPRPHGLGPCPLLASLTSLICYFAKSRPYSQNALQALVMFHVQRRVLCGDADDERIENWRSIVEQTGQGC